MSSPLPPPPPEPLPVMATGDGKVIPVGTPPEKKKVGRKRRRTVEESKALHREVERKRTKQINVLMKEMKSTLDDFGWDVGKRDKGSILQAAVECITSFEYQVQQLKSKESAVVSCENKTNEKTPDVSVTNATSDIVTDITHKTLERVEEGPAINIVD